MAKYKLSRTEIIPMLDENWIAMQMRQFEYGVEIQWDEWESLEQIEWELDVAFLKQRKKASDTVPMVIVREKQIAYLLSEIKRLVPESFNVIVAKAKKISDNQK